MPDDELLTNLTGQDNTRFLERGFAVVENAGHSLRLIKRDDPRQAISIKWDDLPALRELITLALDDGPMVIGLDTSGQATKNVLTAFRARAAALCREKATVLKAEGWSASAAHVDELARLIEQLDHERQGSE